MTGTYHFPNPLAPDSEKAKESFGQEVAKAIIYSTKNYREVRNRKIAKARKFARGEQPVQPYIEQLSDDGKSLYTNINFTARPIASKFEQIVVNGYMEQPEVIKVTGMANHISDKKSRRKDEARFRMEYRDTISQLDEMSGVQMEDPSAFTPETPEELDIWFNLNDRELEEVLMQRMLTFTAEDIKIDRLKQNILSEQFQAGLHGTYDYLDRNGRFNVDFIKAEDCIYSAFDTETSENLNFAGRFVRMTVSEARYRWSLPPEKEKALFSAAMSCKSMYGNSFTNIDWSETFKTSVIRPYDNWVVEIAHVWWACSKVTNFIEGKDRYGKSVFVEIDDPVNVKVSGKKSVGNSLKPTAYEGYFLANDSVVPLEWGECRNMLKEGEDRETLLCPFEFRMPENKGTMMPNSPVHKIISDIMEMDLIDLKIKQVVARSAPSGFAADMDALVNVDLGEGVGLASPIQIQDIYRNTGWLYYRSIRDDGTPNNNLPINPISSPLDAQLGGLLELYNRHRNEIREILGINEFRDGSASQPRIGFRYAQSQLTQSNTATLSLYRAWLTNGQSIYRHAGIRIWDSLAYGEPNKGYLKFLGKKDADFIKHSKEITSSTYDIKFEMGRSLMEEEILENNLTLGIQQGLIDIVDANMVRAIDDYKLANQYLAYRIKVRRKEAEEQAERQSRMAAEANAQAGVMVEQAKAQTESQIAQVRAAVELEKGEQERKKELEKLAYTLILKQVEGSTVPEEYLPLITTALDNMGMSITMEVQAKEAEQEAKAIEEAMLEEQMSSTEGRVEEEVALS